MRTAVAAAVVVSAAFAALAACGDNRSSGTTDATTGDGHGSTDAASPDAAGPPPTLADTGLCADATCATINPGIHAFAPRWILWSDAATKRRWIYLPPGTHIDTSDMNVWSFPQGTKLWKEFTRDGIRVETRMYWKQGPTDGDWYQVAYVWNAAQDQAVATPLGQQNANGTQHDVPSRSDCRKCHDRVGGRILGFSALQLDAPAASGAIDLDYLVANGLLSSPPTRAGSSGPYFPLWPDATATDTAALGYLHANCGHCHNDTSDVFSVCPRIFKLNVTELGAVGDTQTYKTTVNQAPAITIANGTAVVLPGDPDHSALYLHFTSSNPSERMPPLATEIIDPTASQVLHDWIAQMP